MYVTVVITRLVVARVAVIMVVVARAAVRAAVWRWRRSLGRSGEGVSRSPAKRRAPHGTVIQS